MTVTLERVERRLLPDPVLVESKSDPLVPDDLLAPIFQRHDLTPLAITGAGALVFVIALTYTFVAGIGVWGNNIPVAWAFGITNFVWWIGIGHAGTFISAFLLLLEQRWRTSINRLAEAMTLFALMMAGVYPIAHLGRPWFFYWLVPYPSTMRVWPQFRSPLAWDIAAVTTYLTVSLLFWYLGLIPDLAMARDRAPTRRRRIIYGVFALGWRGSVRHWSHYRIAYGLLAGLATPLVVSVHSIVSLDFSVSKLAGWHSTIFPPYFVAGAIFSGFAMVFTLMLPARWAFRLHKVITARHLDVMAKVTLLTGSIVAYAYIVEHFIGWYRGELYESFVMNSSRPFGPYAAAFWVQVVCNVGVPQLLWFPSLRKNAWFLFGMSLLINLGMWMERFVIIVQSLHRDFLPSSWAYYTASIVDWSLFLGSISTFLFLFLLFLRWVPFIPVSEVLELKHALHREEEEAR